MSRLNKKFIVFLLVLTSLSLQACNNENRSPVVPPSTEGQGADDDGSRSFSDEDGGVGEVSIAVFSDDQVIEGSTADATVVFAALEEIGLIFITDDYGDVRAVYTEEVETGLSREELLLNDIDRLSLMIELFDQLKSIDDIEDDILAVVSSVQQSTAVRLELLTSLFQGEELESQTVEEPPIVEDRLIQDLPFEEGGEITDTDIKLR